MRLVVARDLIGIRVAIVNSGEFGEGAIEKANRGVGLENVRRRLGLCYGPESDLTIVSGSGTTIVRFSIPLGSGVPV